MFVFSCFYHGDLWRGSCFNEVVMAFPKGCRCSSFPNTQIALESHQIKSHQDGVSGVLGGLNLGCFLELSQILGGIHSRERENISDQTGKPENHRLKSAFKMGYMLFP